MSWWSKKPKKSKSVVPPMPAGISHTAMPDDVLYTGTVGRFTGDRYPLQPVLPHPTVKMYISNIGVITIAQQGYEVANGDRVYAGETYKGLDTLPAVPDGTLKFRETPVLVTFVDVKDGRVAKIYYLD